MGRSNLNRGSNIFCRLYIFKNLVVMWYGMVWCGVAWCGVVWHGVVLPAKRAVVAVAPWLEGEMGGTADHLLSKY